MRYVVNSALFVAFLAVVSLPSEPSAAFEAEFDGNWTVLVVTERGACDRAYRYAVRVSNGRVNYSGERSVDMNGNVSPNGEVRVGIQFHGQTAKGVGRLSANAGTGSWHGAGSSGVCAGRWEAEKR